MTEINIKEELVIKVDYSFGLTGTPWNTSFSEAHVARVLMQYIPPVLLLVATVGCLLTAVGLLRLRAQLMPSCLYIGFGSLIDLLTLWIYLSNDWALHVFSIPMKQSITYINNSMCKIYPFMANFFIHLSAWLMVALSIETGLSYLRPQRLFKICAYDRARAVILLTIVLLVCANAHCFWSYLEIIDINTKEKVCTAYRQGVSESFRRYILPLLHIILIDLLPLCIILSFTIIVILRWRHFSKNNMDPMSDVNSLKPGPKPRSKHRKFRKPIRTESIKPIHRSIVFICILYVLLLLPKCVYNIFLFVVSKQAGLDKVEFTAELEAKMSLARAISWLLFYMFLVSKFFILLALVPLFRERTMEVLMCLYCTSRSKSKTNMVSASKPLLKTKTSLNKKSGIKSGASRDQLLPATNGQNISVDCVSTTTTV